MAEQKPSAEAVQAALTSGPQPSSEQLRESKKAVGNMGVDFGAPLEDAAKVHAIVKRLLPTGVKCRIGSDYLRGLMLSVTVSVTRKQPYYVCKKGSVPDDQAEHIVDVSRFVSLPAAFDPDSEVIVDMCAKRRRLGHHVATLEFEVKTSWQPGQATDARSSWQPSPLKLDFCGAPALLGAGPAGSGNAPRSPPAPTQPARSPAPEPSPPTTGKKRLLDQHASDEKSLEDILDEFAAGAERALAAGALWSPDRLVVSVEFWLRKFLALGEREKWSEKAKTPKEARQFTRFVAKGLSGFADISKVEPLHDTMEAIANKAAGASIPEIVQLARMCKNEEVDVEGWLAQSNLYKSFLQRRTQRQIEGLKEQCRGGAHHADLFPKLAALKDCCEGLPEDVISCFGFGLCWTDARIPAEEKIRMVAGIAKEKPDDKGKEDSGKKAKKQKLQETSAKWGLLAEWAPKDPVNELRKWFDSEAKAEDFPALCELTCVNDAEAMLPPSAKGLLVLKKKLADGVPEDVATRLLKDAAVLKLDGVDCLDLGSDEGPDCPIEAWAKGGALLAAYWSKVPADKQPVTTRKALQAFEDDKARRERAAAAEKVAQPQTAALDEKAAQPQTAAAEKAAQPQTAAAEKAALDEAAGKALPVTAGALVITTASKFKELYDNQEGKVLASQASGYWKVELLSGPKKGEKRRFHTKQLQVKAAEEAPPAVKDDLPTSAAAPAAAAPEAAETPEDRAKRRYGSVDVDSDS